MQKKSFDLIYENDGNAGGEIVAYASTFDRVPDSYGDIVARGAFAKTLDAWNESGNPIPLLFGHRTDDPRMNLGAVVEASEDERGLRIRAKFDETNEIAQYTRKLVKEGRLTKLSFAYDTIDADFIDLEDGSKARELRELKLYEVSLVPIPANELTEVISAKAAGENADEEVLRELVADDEQDDETKSDDAEEKADSASAEEDLATLATLSERLDAIADMISDIIERLAALAEPKAAADTDIEAADEETEAKDDGNAEDPDEDNAEAKAKATETLERMARYISIN